VGIEGLETVTFLPGQEIGLVQLRKLLQDGGLRDLERQATYAIERNRTHHLLFDEIQLLRWNEPLALIEGTFRLVFFEWPVDYGLRYGRAIIILLTSICGFALVYAAALFTGDARLYRVRPKGRLDLTGSDVEWCEEVKVEQLRWRGLWHPEVFLCAIQFSLLSAFHIGFREFSVGAWLARLQRSQYTLEALGWVRRLSGLQSLLSVYLLAMWALTYFGRPFQ
jgi:hypothetical protein